VGGFVLHRGRVVTREGRGVPRALVAVARGTAPTPEIGIVCDADGYFGIALPPGRYTIEARAPDGRVGSTTILTGSEAQSFEIGL
jgi:hypothetical protein